VLAATAQHYTILDLVAHGWYHADDDETVIYLLNDEGAVKPITATAFIDRLQNLQGARGLPHLAFLSTCESAAPEAEREGALGGLGAEVGPRAWDAGRHRRDQARVHHHRH